MAIVEIYTRPLCGYCDAAKRLLAKKGVSYVETDISLDPAARQQMLERSNGGRTVPQIFIDGRHVGGCDDLHALEAAGGLDPLLSAA